MAGRLVIPKGSIVALPNGNVEHLPLIAQQDIIIPRDQVEIYPTWGEYMEALRKKQREKKNGRM